MAISDNEDAHQYYGRMMECCDIERAIETGQFKTLQDVLAAVKLSANHLQTELKTFGFFENTHAISREEFYLARAQYELQMIGMVKH
jgi:hypothetical protein